MSSLVAKLHDAAVTAEAWPDALTALTDAAGVAGAALIIFNKSTGKVDEAHFCGLSAGFKSDYVRHYAALDPYSPLLDGSRKKLSERLPDRLLRSSEWSLFAEIRYIRPISNRGFGWKPVLFPR